MGKGDIGTPLTKPGQPALREKPVRGLATAEAPRWSATMKGKLPVRQAHDQAKSAPGLDLEKQQKPHRELVDKNDKAYQCDGTISAQWKARIRTRKPRSLPEEMRDIEVWFNYYIAGQVICHNHLRHVAYTAGLNCRYQKDSVLLERLRAVYEHRYDLGKLKGRKPEYKWFHANARPPQFADELGSFKFAPAIGNYGFEKFSFDPKVVFHHAVGDLANSLEEAWE